MPRSTPRQRPSPHHASVKIIGGQWRGRKLTAPAVAGLRPTGSRLRETLFNWLTPYIAGAYCLDAYAGTGALGFEALSRGARFTQFIEADKTVCQQLQQNIRQLNIQQAQVECADFSRWRSQTAQVAFDVVFLDPPFQQQLWDQALEHLIEDIPLSPQALIYLETPKHLSLPTPLGWQIRRQKHSGQITVSLYERAPY